MVVADEGALVQRSCDGDREAFGELVRAYQRVLFNVALRMCNDREDARDVTQAAFLKAWRKLHTFDRRNKFFSWIYRILLNETLNLLRSRRAQEPLDERIVSRERSPADQAEANEIGAIVQSSLMELSTEYRQVIILRHFQQMSHCEIGEVLGLPEKTVKSRLYTARQLLGGVLRRRGVRVS
jgi:RNA polymerase sigma-70 factor (ECF subfamily)